MKKIKLYGGILALILLIWFGAVYCDRQSYYESLQDENFKGWPKIESNNQISDESEIGSGAQVEELPQTNNTPKQTRIDLPNGGYTIMTYNADGSMDSETVQPCQFCSGSSFCPFCGGLKGRMNAYMGIWIACTGCAGTGLCKYCNGTGSVTTYSRVESNGSGSFVSSNGYSGSGSNAGTIVNSPDGTTSAYPKGEGSSNSQRIEKNEYIETIEYDVPNYTGDDDKVWCDKCQEFLYRHTHKRKRVR